MQIGIVSGPWGASVDEVIGSAREAERLGFPSWYLGDHFFVGPQLESYDPFLLFTLVARATSTIRFGPLVSPVTFRPPWEMGRWAAQLDTLSGQRFVMGLGVGWIADEHRAYGVPYGSLKERFDRLDEYIQVMKLLWADGPAKFSGKFYQLDGADALPKPSAGRPPIVIGGGGERRTLNLVAKYANEWNAPTLSPDAYRAKRSVLAKHCEAVDRDPATIWDSMVSVGPIGATLAEIDIATKTLMELFLPGTSGSLAEYRAGLKARGAIVGGREEILDALGGLADAGVNEVVFFDSPGVLQFLASEIAPAVAKL